MAAVGEKEGAGKEGVDADKAVYALAYQLRLIHATCNGWCLARSINYPIEVIFTHIIIIKEGKRRACVHHAGLRS